MTKANKKSKRRIFLLFSVTIIVLALIVSSTFKIWLQIIEKNKEQKLLKEQLVELEDDEQYLRSEVEKLKDPDYVARYAREKYLYSKDGEFTIRIP